MFWNNEHLKRHIQMTLHNSIKFNKINYQRHHHFQCPFLSQLTHSMLTKYWHLYPWRWHRWGGRTVDIGPFVWFSLQKASLLDHVTKKWTSSPESGMDNSAPVKNTFIKSFWKGIYLLQVVFTLLLSEFGNFNVLYL